MSCGSVGDLARLLVEPGASPHVFDVNSEATVFLYEDLGTDRRFGGLQGITGSRAQRTDRIVPLSYVPVGPIALQPGADMIDKWMPRILGGSKSGNNIDPAETLPSFGVLIDRVNGIFQYDDCVVGKAVIRGQAGPSEGEVEVMDMIVWVYAKTEITPEDTSPPSWPGSPPSIPSGALHVPYTYPQSVITLNGNVRTFDRFVITIDNSIIVRNRNSLTPTCFIPGSRRTSLSIRGPFTTSTFSDAFDFYSTGYSASIKFTAGNLSCDFQFPNLRNMLKTPRVPGKTEIPMEMNFIAGSTSGTAYEIRCVNDSTV